MTATLKFKSIWYSFFQAQNSMLIQKSIKPVDKIGNLDDETAPTTTKPTTSSTTSIESATTRSSSTSKALALNPIDDYRIKREKNNESVRKSRAKNRVKIQECVVRVKELKDENVELNNKLNNLQSELGTLRNLFQYCFSFNSNSMPVKPSEIPTSTLFKLIMQNQTKFMQPVSYANLDAIQQQQQQQQGQSQLTFTSNDFNDSLSSSTTTKTTATEFNSVLEQSRLLSLEDLNIQQQQVQINDQTLILDNKDDFFINELKQSLIDFIKIDDSTSGGSINNAISSASVSGPSSPFISSPLTNTTEYMINDNDIIIHDDDNFNIVNNENFTTFLDDHDYSIKRAKLNL